MSHTSNGGQAFYARIPKSNAPAKGVGHSAENGGKAFYSKTKGKNFTRPEGAKNLSTGVATSGKSSFGK